MKYIDHESSQGLILKEGPDPQPGPGQAIVRVEACGVNRADLIQKQGAYPAPSGASHILGLELAGRIERLPAQAPSAWKVGQAVMALVPGGAYATCACVDLETMHPCPAHWSWSEAAAWPEALYTCHLNLIDEGALQQGETVLVHAAAGGIGSMAVQMAKAAGAHVIATVGSAEKAQWVDGLGADTVIRYPEGFIKEQIRSAAPGGVDLVFDTVGGAGYASLHPSIMKPYGRWVLIGLLGGRSATIDLGRMLQRNLRLIGSTLRSRPLWRKRRLAVDLESRWRALWERGNLEMRVDRIFPLAEAEAAHRYLAQNQNMGKVILEMGT